MPTPLGLRNRTLRGARTSRRNANRGALRPGGPSRVRPSGRCTRGPATRAMRGRRHPPRADRDVRRRGLRQAHPPPGLAVLTAGPGITNGISAITTRGSTARRWSCSAGGRPSGAGAPARCRSWTTCRSSPRSPSRPATVHGPPTMAARRRARGGRHRHDPAPRAGVPRLPARRVFGPAEGELAATRRGRGGRARPDAVARVGELIAGAERPAFIVGQRRLLGRRLGRAAARRRALRVPVLLQRARSWLPARPTTSWRSCAPGPAEDGRRSSSSCRHAARLPPRLRPLRRRRGRPRRRRRVASGGDGGDWGRRDGDGE